MSKLSTRRYVDRLFDVHRLEIDRRFADVKEAVVLARSGTKENQDDSKAWVAIAISVAVGFIALATAVMAAFALLKHGG